MIRISQIGVCTDVLGPGRRLVIWTQGCEKRCPGCMSPEKRSPDGGQAIAVDDLVKKVLELCNEDELIDGLTISGGDPFFQSEKLHIFLKEIRTKSDLGVIIYTGYTIAELVTKNEVAINEIVGAAFNGVGKGLCDLFIEGEYVKELNDNSAMRGSSNQKLCFVTDRYKKYEKDYNKKERKIELIYKGGSGLQDWVVVGVPSKEALAKLRAMESTN